MTSDPQTPAVLPAGFRPLLCADLELAAPEAPSPAPQPGTGLLFLVRLHGQPVGELLVEPDEVAAGPPVWAQRACAESAGVAARSHLVADGVPAANVVGAELAALCTQAATRPCQGEARPAEPLPRVAAVICTMGRHEVLPAAVRALLAQDYLGETVVIVVDNDPTTGATDRALAEVSDPRLRVVAEPRRGLSNARNTAIRQAVAADAEIVCFTDDDAVADRGWVRALAAAVTVHPDVRGATGLVVPGSLLLPAEQVFEGGATFNRGYAPMLWSLPGGLPAWTGERGEGGLWFPFAAWHLGSGNCMAFRTDVLVELGGFDAALGAGTPSASGEDVDIFFRIIVAGGALVYEPRAIVRHFHRQTGAASTKQIQGYKSGASAFVFRELLMVPAARGLFVRVAVGGIKRRLTGRPARPDPAAVAPEPAPAASPAPAEPPTAELPTGEPSTAKPPTKVLTRGAALRAYASGPWLYLKGRSATRRARN